MRKIETQFGAILFVDEYEDIIDNYFCIYDSKGKYLAHIYADDFDGMAKGTGCCAYEMYELYVASIQKRFSLEDLLDFLALAEYSFTAKTFIEVARYFKYPTENEWDLRKSQQEILMHPCVNVVGTDYVVTIKK